MLAAKRGFLKMHQNCLVLDAVHDGTTCTAIEYKDPAKKVDMSTPAYWKRRRLPNSIG